MSRDRGDVSDVGRWGIYVNMSLSGIPSIVDDIDSRLTSSDSRAPSTYNPTDQATSSRQTKRRPQTPSGQVYAAGGNSTTTDHVVVGIILISTVRARALFDTRESNSFINKGFTSLLGLEIRPLSHAREVQILEHILHVGECCWSCPVQLGSWIMSPDLVVLRQLEDFDVVLGMD